MSLKRLVSKRKLNILGLNSGTSADGLDMALVAISSRGNVKTIKVLTGHTRSYPDELRKRLLHLADAGQVELDELIYLDNVLGSFCGKAASRYIKRLTARGLTVDAVASHGQTVRHLPRRVRRLGETVRGSLQLGSPEFVATATGRVVVADFRQGDIALGNEGAPITAAAMARLLTVADESRLIVNIGGMSNYFYLPAANSRFRPLAADCGPGNSLCDILSWSLFREKFDRDGRHASRGDISGRLLSALRRMSRAGGSTVSTGREKYGPGLAAKAAALGREQGLSKNDLMATVAQLTVSSVVAKVAPIAGRDKRLTKLYLTGGGRHNIFFVEKLKNSLPDLAVRPIDELGLSGDHLEAVAYAVMGEACLRSEALPTNFTGDTGNALCPVPGSIVQPPDRAQRT
ncbi:MAG: anhydro-N-acetylmuramic acid kinase [Candidatus Zixiibacteriota bacterium]|nr:MAG: anhydro-N-acetylmuramic acid kinase [candidate division Zixibacteria bacterium]